MHDAQASRPALRRCRRIALAATVLVIGAGEDGAAAHDSAAAKLRVGHTVERMVVPGSAEGEPRPVDVHLWYPADKRNLAKRPRTVYRSALHGLTLIPERWDPLSWTVEAEVAREGAAIDRHGRPFPVIVVSHGSTNDPIDYAHTLELIAGAGFVVAAPSHVNNTQDDARIDFINNEAGVPLFACRDGRPSPCARPNVPRSMEDRVNDIRSTLDALPSWLGDRVDVSRAGVLGHSRGTVSSLAAAGGSTLWGFGPEPRVKAIMGLAIGAPAITFGADIAAIGVPSVLVAGALDRNPGGNANPPFPAWTVSKDAFDAISTDKAFVLIGAATHRTFDSTYCDQLRSAGAATVAAGANDETEPRAILDWHTARLIGASFPGGLSGKAHEYCSSDTFQDTRTGFDITGLMRSLEPDFPEFTASDPAPTPTTGLETDEVKRAVSDLAVAFFGTELERKNERGPRFTRRLAKWLHRYDDMVSTVEAYAGGDAICLPGQDSACGH